MKTKKFNKKLRLNKKTVANLNGSMMGHVHGGVTPENQLTQSPSCFLPHTECPDCTMVTCQTCVTCNTCNTCVTQACMTCDTCPCAID